MSPEYEEAAKELEGKVRFVKLDTDESEQMAARLAINGLPTLLFLDKYTPPEGSDEEVSKEEQEAQAVLKGRIEGPCENKTFWISAITTFSADRNPRCKIHSISIVIARSKDWWVART